MTNTIINKHDCADELKEANLKSTPARLGVLKALEDTDIPLNISEITKYLKSHSVKADKVTIFRIINALVDNGLARPIQLNEGRMRFEHSARADHHHFICEICSAIEDISDCHIGRLEKEINSKKGLIIKRHSLEFFGICKSCQL